MIFIPVISGILLGSIYGINYKESYIRPSTSLDGLSGEITAVITSVDYESEYLTTYTAKLMTFNGRKKEVKTVIELPSSCQADVNDLIKMNASLKLPSDEEERGFNEKEYYNSEGIFILCYGDDLEIIGYDRSIPSFFRSLSLDMSSKLRVCLGENNGGFISALILGKKELLPDRMNTSFRYLGISHILSVSGLHLAVLMAAVTFIASLFIPNRYILVLLTTLFSVAFVILVGAPPSAIRAAVMIFLTILAIASGRPSVGIHFLAVASFVISLTDPSLIFSASYLMSMGASLGIIVLGGPACSTVSKRILDRNGVIRTLGAMGMLVCITLSATLFTLPVVAYFFGEISVVSVPANLLFVPVCTVLIYLAALLLLFYSTPLCPLFTYAVSYISSLIDRLSYTLSLKLPEPASLTYPFITATVVLTVLTVLVFLLFLNKRRLTCLLVASFVLTSSYLAGYGIYSQNHKNDTSVICLNDGSNDFIMLCKDGQTLLIDISNGSSSSLSYAASLSQTKLHDASVDTLLLTHLHRNHITAVSKLADKTRVRQIYIPKPQDDDEGYFATALERVASDRGLELCYYDAQKDSVFDFNGCKLTVFGQDKIDRSVQPIHLIMLQGRKNLVYCGSGINDAPDLFSTLEGLCYGESYLWLGSHGPLIKRPIALPYTVNDTFVSNNNVNNGYLTSYPTLNGYMKIDLE